MNDELSLSFLLNNGIAIGVAWYVLTRLNHNLDKLSQSIDNLNRNINDRLTELETSQQQFQILLHELKLNVDVLRRGDS